ncbi:MAG TPA: biotin/lipoyl-binding protein, partial [Planctomycetota bacterium]|nr:biotin/lipoyl-binding protein [Planctomycetota bacterium]
MNTFKRSSLVLAVPVVLALGCDREPPPTARTPASAPAASSPTVPVARVISQKLSKSIRLPGELWAYRNVAVFAKVQGFVEKIDVDRGSEVKEGDLLAKLTAPEFEAQRIEADARLASNLATYRRLEEAAKTPGVVAGNDVDI